MRPLSVNLETLRAQFSSEDWVIVSRVFKKNGALRASKPDITYTIVKRHMYGRPDAPLADYRENNLLDAKSAYVWRMVVFSVSDVRAHQCMPICADMDLPIEDYQERRALCKELDTLADRIINLFPKREWRGVIAWGNALGVLGSPELDSSGAVVDRGTERNSNTWH